MLVLKQEHLYLDRFNETLFDVCSGRQEVGAIRDMLRNLIADWSQEVTEKLQEGREEC